MSSSTPPGGPGLPGPPGSPLPPSDRALRESLADLSALLIGTIDLSELLTRVAGLAARAVPGADGAGITLLRVDGDMHRVEALAASDPFVSQVDEIQYTVLNEGPCITAARDRRPVHSGSLGGDQEWPRFGPRVGRLGVHSVVSLPLQLADGPAAETVVGAVNVYAHAKDAFDDRAVMLGEQFAAPAAVTVHNAHVLDRTRRLTEQLQTAMSSRPVIDQAIGLIRGRSGGSAEEAFSRLRAISQRENAKLSVIAERVVEEAVRSAIARRKRPSP